jgi:hypothetical protein
MPSEGEFTGTRMSEWHQLVLPGFERFKSRGHRVLATSTGVRVDKTKKEVYSNRTPARGTGVPSVPEV